MKREKLSALVDGELDESDMHAVTPELADAEARASMELYYLIGEELRAGSATANLSPEFSAKMAAALADEMPHATPVSSKSETPQLKPEVLGHSELERQPFENAARHSVSVL